MTDEDAQLGYLGAHGVLIVPPVGEDAGWLVTVGAWDDGAEAYVAGSDGPLLDTREEAMETATRAMEWLKGLDPDVDVRRLWREMQDAIAAQENPEAVLRSGYRWPFP